MTITSAFRTHIFALSISIVCATSAHAAPDVSPYLEANKALRTGKTDQYIQLRRALNDDPLSIYLDYRYLSPRISNQSVSTVNEFLSRAEGTPLALRLKRRYLALQGKKRNWKNFLAVSPTEPTRTELRCYYHRALLQSGQAEQAYAGAESLWLSGKSQPKACDTLFSEWAKAGQRSNDDVWRRMLLTYDARQSSLMTYLSRKLTGEYKASGEKLRELYQNPRRISRYKDFKKDTGRNRDIVSSALRKLARTSPQQAIKHWTHYQAAFKFERAQASEITKQLVLYSYSRNDSTASQWADQQLASLQVDQLTDRRIRQLLRKQDWQAVEARIYDLSEKEQQSERWQYWLAHIERSRGEAQKADERLTKIAGNRGYYSYLAADMMETPYQLNKNAGKTSEQASHTILSDAGLKRVEALIAADEPDNANSEWIYLLRRASSEQKVALANYALTQGWWHMAINSAIQAGEWDDVTLRFPLGYEEDFKTFAKMRNVDISLLMAIARRESTFNPRARSPKDARGLMQLMPATAKATAKKIGLRYKGTESLYQSETNIRLGSAYIKQVLGQFNQNQILAIASYNAGPHRVKRWVNDDTTLPFDVWVETIPFKETRAYVQAVLAYRVIYDLKLNGKTTSSMLTSKEKAAKY
ncbi:transglycosylase SLT domain-containing protein [Echinimonas agarilytica]|uniref:Transglycosylase SLT domain-containing protein n=1 Tax=Echinimonas agarilytica TaxID=1215918 RepID=A0AA41W6H2_9GAMM|nr:transglycosylase SLT domain-containing protein [Echinimonas agarilytica]MCM2679516.1 transglycosylase SLT domain-containing protein [Echinimonas agarilytica]